MIVSAATAGDAAKACRNPAGTGCAGRLSTVTNGDSERLGKASGLSRRLLALLVGLLAMVALIASGAPSAAAQNAVGAQPQNSIFTVGAQSLADPESVGLHTLQLRPIESATGVAAETALTENQIGSTTEDILANATRGKVSTAVQYSKAGGFNQANSDFDLLTSGVDVVDRGGGLRTATLSNGTKVNVRPFSSGKIPTLEIDTPGNPAIKVRY